MVPVNLASLPEDRDFLFEPQVQSSLSMYAHLVDSSLTSVLVKNSTDYPIQIPRKAKLGSIQEVNYKNYFNIDTEISWAKKATMVAATAAVYLIVFSTISNVDTARSI